MAQVLVYDLPSLYSPSTPIINDQAIFQNMLDQFQLIGGGELILSKQTYYLEYLYIPSNITIVGNGVTFKQIQFTIPIPSFNGNPIFNIENKSNVKLFGINFDGNKFDVEGDLTHGIAILGSKDIILENLTFNNIKKVAIYCGESTELNITERISILNCSATNLGIYNVEPYIDKRGSFLNCNKCNDIKLVNINVDKCSGEIVLLLLTTNFELKNFDFKNSYISEGVSIAGCNNLKIENGVIENMKGCGIEINEASNFIVNNINIKECVLYGILIATYIDTTNGITGKPSCYGSINNTNIFTSVHCQTSNYSDILIAGSHHISISEIITNYKVSITETVLSTGTLISEHINLKNSSLNTLNLRYTKNIELKENTILNITNVESSYALVKDTNQFDLFFKGYVGSVIPSCIITFELPVIEVVPPNNIYNCGLVNGLVIIDNGFVSDPNLQYTSKMYHVRSDIKNISTPWSTNIISTLDGTVPRDFDASFIDNKIIVINTSGVDTIVRVTLKSMFDTWG
jgi:hypothetical protein